MQPGCARRASRSRRRPVSVYVRSLIRANDEHPPAHVRGQALYSRHRGPQEALQEFAMRYRALFGEARSARLLTELPGEVRATAPGQREAHVLRMAELVLQHRESGPPESGPRVASLRMHVDDLPASNLSLPAVHYAPHRCALRSRNDDRKLDATANASPQCTGSPETPPTAPTSPAVAQARTPLSAGTDTRLLRLHRVSAASGLWYCATLRDAAGRWRYSVASDCVSSESLARQSVALKLLKALESASGWVHIRDSTMLTSTATALNATVDAAEPASSFAQRLHLFLFMRARRCREIISPLPLRYKDEPTLNSTTYQVTVYDPYTDASLATGDVCTSRRHAKQSACEKACMQLAEAMQ